MSSLAVVTASLPDIVNPFRWDSRFFFALIGATLLLRLLLPRSSSWVVRFSREFLLIAPAAIFYFLVRGLMDARTDDAVANAELVIRLERALGIFQEPRMQRWILEHDWLVTFFNWIYIWGHWPVIAITVTWLITNHHERFPAYRNAMLISGGIGMLIFALFPVAPPRLMETLDVVDTVTRHSESYRVLQPPALTNPFAAMPSLHFGWDLLAGITIARHASHRALSVVGLLLPPLMFLAIVLTANHYILDGVAGAALVLAALLIAERVTRPKVNAIPVAPPESVPHNPEPA